jgi:hypothetical protein
LLSKFEISLNSGYAPEYQILPITKPKDGLKIHLKRI